MSYETEYRRSINEQEQFWQDRADDIKWFKPPTKILSKDENGVDRWFADGELNTAYLALDYHVEKGEGDRLALIYDSPVTDSKRTYTYEELTDAVAQFSGALASLGVSKSDTVLIYMPMVPEAVIAMLACARLGAIHSVVFGGFSADELQVRIDDAKPKVLVTASCGIEVENIIPYKPIVDKAIQSAGHETEHCIVYQRPQCLASMVEGRDKDWLELFVNANPVPCATVNALDPLYILYTSGTTGKPKGIVRDNGGHAVALKYSMKAIYDCNPGDVYWAASDVGWVVGHSYIVYGPLLAGCTTVLFEGKPVRTPDAGAFWRMVDEYKINTLFAAPTAFRAIKKEDPEGQLIKQYDLASLKHLYVAGERLDPPTYEWMEQKLNKPVIDHWWQTETGWAIVANMRGLDNLPTKAGSSSLPVTGFDVRIFDHNGDEKPSGEPGEIVVKLPLPPSCFPTIWNDFPRFEEAYLKTFPGYFLSGDGGYKDEDGYVFIMGRTDDVINVAGHRFSTGEMEEIIGSHQAIAECAVIGIQDDLRGQVPVAFALLKNDANVSDEQLQKEVVELVRGKIGAVAYLRQVAIVARLPKTRSGKILRKTMRLIADGETYSIPSTIEDPASLEEVTTVMKQNKIGVYA
ncbi:MAG: propionyl-CoA synthetase [Pseudomonadales bacterium]|nr:propionyl-CoA synthetase [Pseudomonadales bacterium]